MRLLIFFSIQTANLAYFQRKINFSEFFCISGWLAVRINTDKWSSTLLTKILNNAELLDRDANNNITITWNTNNWLLGHNNLEDLKTQGYKFLH